MPKAARRVTYHRDMFSEHMLLHPMSAPMTLRWLTDRFAGRPLDEHIVRTNWPTLFNPITYRRHVAPRRHRRAGHVRWPGSVPRRCRRVGHPLLRSAAVGVLLDGPGAQIVAGVATVMNGVDQRAPVRPAAAASTAIWSGSWPKNTGGASVK